MRRRQDLRPVFAWMPIWMLRLCILTFYVLLSPIGMAWGLYQWYLTARDEWIDAGRIDG